MVESSYPLTPHMYGRFVWPKKQGKLPFKLVHDPEENLALEAHAGLQGFGVVAVEALLASGCFVCPLEHRRRFDLDEFAGGRVAVDEAVLDLRRGLATEQFPTLGPQDLQDAPS